MSAGLAALLDDVAALARAAAASLDDVAAGASLASVKAAGVIVDDTAVTPRYVRGFRPERELPMIKGSLRGGFMEPECGLDVAPIRRGVGIRLSYRPKGRKSSIGPSYVAIFGKPPPARDRHKGLEKRLFYRLLVRSRSFLIN